MMENKTYQYVSLYYSNLMQPLAHFAYQVNFQDDDEH